MIPRHASAPVEDLVVTPPTDEEVLATLMLDLLRDLTLAPALRVKPTWPPDRNPGGITWLNGMPT